MSIENPVDNERIQNILSGNINPDVKGGPTAEVIIEDDKAANLVED